MPFINIQKFLTLKCSNNKNNLIIHTCFAGPEIFFSLLCYFLNRNVFMVI